MTNSNSDKPIISSKTLYESLFSSYKIKPKHIAMPDISKDNINVDENENKQLIDTFKTNIEKDDNFDIRGSAVYDPKDNCLTIRVPTYVDIVSISIEHIILNYKINSQTQYSTLYDTSFFTLKVDESLRPCCSWYSPSAKQIEKGAEQIEDYPFVKDKEIGACSNPEITGSKHSLVNCRVFPNFSFCSSVQISDWTAISFLRGEQDEVLYELQKKFFSSKVPSYRLYDLQNQCVVDHVVTPKDFESFAAENNLSIQHKKNKKSYFEMVLK